MKRNILLTLGAVFAFGLVVSATVVGVARAADVRTGDKPTLASSETTDSTLYAAGNSITVAGTVRGDLFCAGANIDITGTVEGDVICAGQTVRVAGTVLGDVRVAGQSIEIVSEVQGSVTAMGESVIFARESKIGRDVTVGGSRVHLEGAVGRDVLGGAEVVRIAGAVGRTFDAEVASLTLDSKARIGGDLNYSSASPAHIAGDAVVSGQTRYTHRVEDSQRDTASAYFWSAVYGFVAMLMIGLAALIFTPRALDAVGVAIRKRSGISFAVGAAVLVVTPIVGIVLLASVFGIPLAIILFMLWIAALISSYVFAAYALGWFAVEKLQWPKRGRRLASLIIGLLIMCIIGVVPLVGPVVIFLFMLTGMGALAFVSVTRLKGAKAPAKEKA